MELIWSFFVIQSGNYLLKNEYIAKVFASGKNKKRTKKLLKIALEYPGNEQLKDF